MADIKVNATSYQGASIVPRALEEAPLWTQLCCIKSLSLAKHLCSLATAVRRLWLLGKQSHCSQLRHPLWTLPVLCHLLFHTHSSDYTIQWFMNPIQPHDLFLSTVYTVAPLNIHVFMLYFPNYMYIRTTEAESQTSQYLSHSWVHCLTDSRSSINTINFSRIPEWYGSWNKSFHPPPKLRSRELVLHKLCTQGRRKR